MRITAIESVFVDRYLFVQVHTDAGITGLGESGAWGFLEASAQAVETFKRYLISQDPLRICPAAAGCRWARPVRWATQLLAKRAHSLFSRLDKSPRLLV